MRPRFAFVLAAVVVGALACVTALPAAADQAWVELTGHGPEARVATTSATCPAIDIDGKTTAMTERWAPGGDFPVRVCQAPLPKGAQAASIGGQPLPIPIAAPRRIIIFGDTGCRLKGSDVQNCDDPAQWPFARVAQLAASHHPDLVIHVGDYYYRESACPAGRAGCAGSPWGDNWTTWQADFFTPAAPLLAGAPWVLVRGNHEDCERGGPGWFTLLDAGPTPLACPATAAPVAIDLGGLTLYILDSSGTDDRGAPPGLVANFAAQLDALRAHPPAGPAWILTHRPIWGLVPVASMGPIGPLEVPINATEQAAVRGRSLAGVQMVVSGHIHHFAAISFHGDRPAQLVAGTGGDVGEPADTPRFIDGAVGIDGLGAHRFGFDRYGFLLLVRQGADWLGEFYDVRGRPIVHCKLVERALSCAPNA